MRPIKFRGKDYYFGRHIFGDLQHEGQLKLIAHDGYRETVDPDSIAQLVTVISGNEYYEGDVIECGGKKYVAALEETFHEAD